MGTPTLRPHPRQSAMLAPTLKVAMHHLVMDVTLAKAVEPDNTALGRAVRETDRMVIRSMMEAVKDPAFNQALNSILLDTSKPRGRKTAHCLIFICGKLETETFQNCVHRRPAQRRPPAALPAPTQSRFMPPRRTAAWCPAGHMPAMSGPRNSRGQTAHYTSESADTGEPAGARVANMRDTEAKLLALFAEATSPNKRAMLADAIQYCADLCQTMSEVSKHSRDAEQALAAFEQREGMRSPAAYGQPDAANTAMDLESSSLQIFLPWGAGGSKLRVDDNYVFTATKSRASAPTTVDARCMAVLPDYRAVAPPEIPMGDTPGPHALTASVAPTSTPLDTLAARTPPLTVMSTRAHPFAEIIGTLVDRLARPRSMLDSSDDTGAGAAVHDARSLLDGKAALPDLINAAVGCRRASHHCLRASPTSSTCIYRYTTDPAAFAASNALAASQQACLY